jgi:hypothetical protein
VHVTPPHPPWFDSLNNKLCRVQRFRQRSYTELKNTVMVFSLCSAPQAEESVVSYSRYSYLPFIPAGALSLGLKRPGCGADHSPPSSAEVKEWVQPYLHSPIGLHGVEWCSGQSPPSLKWQRGTSWWQWGPRTLRLQGFEFCSSMTWGRGEEVVA